MDAGAERKVSGREAISAHVAAAGGAVAGVPVELADGGGSYRCVRTGTTPLTVTLAESHTLASLLLDTRSVRCTLTR